MPTDAQHTKAHPTQTSAPSLISPLLICSIALRTVVCTAHTVITPLTPAGWVRLAQHTVLGACHQTRPAPVAHRHGRRSSCEQFRSAGALRRPCARLGSPRVRAGYKVADSHLAEWVGGWVAVGVFLSVSIKYKKQNNTALHGQRGYFYLRGPLV